MRVRLLAAACLLAGCIDFRQGIACRTNSDCFDYECVSGECHAPEDGASGGAGGGGTPAGGGSGGGAGSGLVALATSQTDAAHLVQDSSSLYWTARSGTNLILRTVSKSGGGPMQLANLGAPAFREPALAVSGNHVYAVNGTRVMRVPKAGGQLETLETSAAGEYGGGVGVASTTLVWLTSGDDGTVWKRPLAGGAVATVATGEDFADELIVAQDRVYWTVRDGVVVFDLATSLRTRFPTSMLHPKALSSNGAVVVWLEGQGFFDQVSTTTVGSSTSKSFDLDRDLTAVASDGASTVFATARSTQGSSSTDLITLNTMSGAGTSVRLTGGSSVTGGLASEIVADQTFIFVIVHDQILRRAR